MKKIFIILMLVVTMVLSSCSSVASDKNNNGGNRANGSNESNLEGISNGSTSKTLDGKIKFYPTYDSDYKTANNDVCGFWFDIPKEWNADDLSEDGSEFTILTGRENIVIKIYGVMKNESDDEFYKSLAGKNGKITDFTYRDGWIGKEIEISEGERYYVRVDGDSYIVFYFNINGDTEWFNENKDKINYIAMSARTARKSYGSGLDEKKYITPDDLQLGEIKLGITVDELNKIMNIKPVKEEKEEYEGLVAKTLFYPDDTQIYVVDDVVYSINVTSPNYETPRGLKVGDSTEKVRELYGEPANINEDGYWGYCYDGYELFTLRVKNGKVAEIQVDLAM